MTERIDLPTSESGEGIPVITVPENENDIITQDGRYFVDGLAFLGMIHDDVHIILDEQDITDPTDEAMVSAASSFAHFLLNSLRARVETTVLEAQLALSDV